MQHSTRRSFFKQLGWSAGVHLADRVASAGSPVNTVTAGTPRTNERAVECRYLGDPASPTKWASGLYLKNEVIHARFFSPPAHWGNVVYHFLPADFGRVGGQDLLYAAGVTGRPLAAPGSMYLRYDGVKSVSWNEGSACYWWDQGKRPNLVQVNPAIVLDSPTKKVIRFCVEDRPSAVVSCFLTVRSGEPWLYYSFLVRAKRDLKEVAMDFLLGSKFNFDVYGKGEPTQSIPFKGKASFSNWASAWSQVRKEGLMIALDGKGRFELHTGYEWWFVGSFDLADIKAGSEKQFGFGLRYLGQSQAEGSTSAYRELKKNGTFDRLRAEAKKLLSVEGKELVPVSLFAGNVCPIPEPRDLAWAQERARKFGVIRFVQILTSLTRQVSASKVKEWIDQMAASGYNIVSLQNEWGAAIQDWGLENWKEVIRYGHSKGVRMYIHYTSTNERQAIDLLCDPELGDACLDGFGFDYELAKTDLKGTYFYSIDDIRADDVMVADFSKKTGRDMKEATLEEIRKWYGETFAAWYGDIYRYLKKKNPRTEFWTTAAWYDAHFSRALVRECPGIIVQTYDYSRAPNAHYQHFVRAWQNAGAITAPIVLELANLYIPNAMEAAMQAGADGISHWRWMIPEPGRAGIENQQQIEIFGAEVNASMLRFFPGDLSKPFAAHPPAAESYSSTHFWPWLKNLVTQPCAE